jgi:hypothetical protein
MIEDLMRVGGKTLQDAEEPSFYVTPAEAGVQKSMKSLDSRSSLQSGVWSPVSELQLVVIDCEDRETPKNKPYATQSE